MTTQQKKNFPLAAAMLLLMASTTQAADNEHQFAIGPTIGMTNFTGKTPGEPKEKDLGANFGLTGRYTHNMQGGWFVGVQIGGAIETAKYDEASEELSNVTLNEDNLSITTGDVNASIKPKWSMDILARVGRKHGAASTYIAAGVALASVKAALSADASVVSLDDPAVSGALAISAGDTQTHLGWKIAAGIDYDFSEQVQLFVQGYYAGFGKKDYGLLNAVDISASGGPAGSLSTTVALDDPDQLDLSGYGAQLGILFKF